MSVDSEETWARSVLVANWQHAADEVKRASLEVGSATECTDPDWQAKALTAIAGVEKASADLDRALREWFGFEVTNLACRRLVSQLKVPS